MRLDWATLGNVLIKRIWTDDSCAFPQYKSACFEVIVRVYVTSYRKDQIIHTLDLLGKILITQSENSVWVCIKQVKAEIYT